MKTALSFVLAFALTLPVFADERPVKNLKEVEGFLLGLWESEVELPQDISGFAEKGTKVKAYHEAKYTHDKKFIQIRGWYEKGDQKIESDGGYLGPDPMSGDIKFWTFDLIAGVPVDGLMFTEGDNFYYRGTGKFLPQGEQLVKQFGKDLVPWSSEFKITVTDAKTRKAIMSYVKFNGNAFPWPGVGTESVEKRIR